MGQFLKKKNDIGTDLRNLLNVLIVLGNKSECSQFVIRNKVLHIKKNQKKIILGEYKIRSEHLTDYFNLIVLTSVKLFVLAIIRNIDV